MPINFTKDHFKWTNGRGHSQRPILYSQKKNNYGLGKKEHSSDQWWEKAFDSQLKNLDVTGTSAGVTVKQSMPLSTAIGMEKMAKYYIRFVKGGVLVGEVEKMIAEAEAGAEDVSTASEEERKLERKEKKGSKKDRRKGEKDERRRKRGVKEPKESKEERRDKKRLKRLVEKELKVLKSKR